MLFFTVIFQLLVQQTNLYYQQHMDKQAGTSRRLPHIMTFTALALQMAHVKDTLHDYWSRLEQIQTPFFGEIMTRDRYLHILRVRTLRTIHGDPTQARSMTDYGK
jgi:hypothetical protein